jgi:hypothetical protein
VATGIHMENCLLAKPNLNYPTRKRVKRSTPVFQNNSLEYNYFPNVFFAITSLEMFIYRKHKSIIANLQTGYCTEPKIIFSLFC